MTLGSHVTQCSSLKCADAFQCEGFQNSHTSLKLSDVLATLHSKKLEIGHIVMNMKNDMMSHYIEEVHAIK
jgi:hypothetical protein